MNIEKIKAAITRVIEATGEEPNCMTLCPAHFEKMNRPDYIMGIEVIEAVKREGLDNPLIEKGYSIIGVYNEKEDYYDYDEII